jgi:class 3 adenylate cyclase/tetratricopeptide (TPR) repeat protein
MRCDRCGEENPDRARFCSSCGAQLVTEPRQERKVVSVLFVDLVGFTGSSDRRDPEDVRDVLQAYHRAAETAISSFGGNMEKFIGDAVMAVFGAPVSHGDDAERAVRAGLKVLESVKQLGLDARGGVNTGEAVVAVGAAASSGQALAMGDVVNTASRLQTAAPPGGLIVGEETYLLTREAIQYQQHVAVDAKGKSEPVEAWLALAPIQSRAEKPRTPLVGRDREMQLLGSIWDRAITDRRPHLVTLLGPPGIGKSRLQREFSEYVRQADGAVAKGRCLPYGERTAYGAFIQMMRDTCGIYENDSADAARAKLGDIVAQLLPPSEAEETTFNLTVLLGLSAGEQSLQRGYLFFAARRFIEALALARPLLLILEDLHWADTGLLDLVEYLAAYVKDSPLVILCLARPEFIDRRPAWGSGLHAHTTIALEPLSSEDASTLARTLLAAIAGRNDAADQLAQAGEGNPLFIEELASSLGDKAEAEFRLPTTIRAAIASRLDALPATARDVLLDASVIGRTFWRGVLQRMSDHADLDNDLALLESRDFIRRVGTTQVRGDIEYLFKHILIHDVAYATLPRSIRRQRHRAVAEYIEEAVQDTTGLSTILAHHWREAGEAPKAIEYLMRAAEQALNSWALTEAVSLYDSAIALATDDKERFRIMLARGLARSRLGAYPEAVSDLAELMPHLDGRDRIEALLGYGWALQWTEATDETIAAAEEALRLAEVADDRELVPVAKGLLSQGLAMRGGPGDLDSAGEVGEEALRLWVPGARPWWRLNHEHMLGEQFYWTGRLADGHALMHSASRSGSDPQSIQARLRSAALKAQILCSLGQYEDSIRLFDETMRIAVEAGRPTRILRNYSSQPLRELFDVAEARRRSEESLEGPDEAAGFLMPRANARADVMTAALLAGDLETAERFWRLQWDESNNTRAWTRWLMVCRLAAARAQMELMSSHTDQAIEWGRKAIELSKPVRRLKYEIVGRTILGRALVAASRPDQAVTELTLAAPQADSLGSPSVRWEVLAALGRAQYAAGDDNAAESAFSSASSVIRDIASGLEPHRAERFLGAEPVRDVLKGATKTVR